MFGRFYTFQTLNGIPRANLAHTRLPRGFNEGTQWQARLFLCGRGTDKTHLQILIRENESARTIHSKNYTPKQQKTFRHGQNIPSVPKYIDASSEEGPPQSSSLTGTWIPINRSPSHKEKWNNNQKTLEPRTQNQRHGQDASQLWGSERL